MNIFIGAYLPDRQLDESPFCQVLIKVAVELAQLRQHSLLNCKPNLDLAFLLPGSEEQPEFQGMRLHSFDSSTQTLKIESAVPRQMIGSSKAEEYVIAVMQDAVDGAYEFFGIQQMPFQRDEYLSLIDAIRTRNGASMH